jgi:ATP-dependent DNA helicase RecG
MQSESQNIEYKESWRDEYLKWICGFANAYGGSIYIGVNDSGEAVGLADAKKLMEDIPNKIVNYLGIVEDVNLHSESGKEYIEIKVAPSNIPIAYKGAYHYRSGSTKQELKGQALQQFIMKKMGQSWDDIPVYGATVDDIDRSAIDYFLQCSIRAGRMDEEEANATTEDVLRNLGLYTVDGELKNAAILLFGKHVGQFFPSATFKIGRFHTDESDLIMQDVIEGNIIQMASRVMKALRTKYLISPISYEGLQRVEQLEIPENALRELIYNAIAHKNYSGPAIQMRVYDRSIELWNYGLLPEELTPADLLKQHSSFPRNHNIANVFYKAGFVETWGRGYKKIADAFNQARMNMPTIEERQGGVAVIICRRTVDDIIAERGGDGGASGGKDGGDVAVMELSNRQRLILSYIVKQPNITAKQMAVMTDIPQRTIERELATLQKGKLLRREGSPRTGWWVIVRKAIC